MSKFKNVTHYIAAGLTLAIGFISTPAGQSLIAQYPKLSSLATALVGIGAVVGVYLSPVKVQ